MRFKKLSQAEPWALPPYIYDNYNLISVNYLIFIFNQAEKLLEQTIRSGEGITERAYKILTVSLTILTSCLVYLSSIDHLTSKISLTALFSIPFCLLSIGFLILPMKSYETFVLGSSPAKLLVKESIENFEKGEEQTKNILLSECVSYQERIQFNELINRARSKHVDRAMFSLFGIPFIPLFQLIGNSI